MITKPCPMTSGSRVRIARAEDDHSQFLTEQQIEHVMGAATEYANQFIEASVDNMFTNLARRSNAHAGERSAGATPDRRHHTGLRSPSRSSPKRLPYGSAPAIAAAPDTRSSASTSPAPCADRIRRKRSRPTPSTPRRPCSLSSTTSPLRSLPSSGRPAPSRRRPPGSLAPSSVPSKPSSSRFSSPTSRAATRSSPARETSSSASTTRASSSGTTSPPTSQLRWDRRTGIAFSSYTGYGTSSPTTTGSSTKRLAKFPGKAFLLDQRVTVSTADAREALRDPRRLVDAVP